MAVRRQRGLTEEAVRRSREGERAGGRVGGERGGGGKMFSAAGEEIFEYASRPESGEK